MLWSSFFCRPFIVSLYLVEYPYATGAFGRVSISSNCLNFNGYECLSFTISEPTESATTFHGVLALVMIEVILEPGSSEFQLMRRRRCGIRVFTVQGEGPAGALDEVLAGMEVLGAVAGECGAVRRTLGVFPGT